MASRDNILNKIRTALTKSTPIPFPQSNSKDNPIQPLQEDIVVHFAEQFTQLLGKFSFCNNEEEMLLQLVHLCNLQQWTKVYCAERWEAFLPNNIRTDDIITSDAAITSCEALVARTGSMVVSSNNSGRITSVYAPVHICIAYTSQLVYDIKDALERLTHKYGEALPSLISFATGPSRTADIEKTLVVGVHGPKEVYCFLVDDTSFTHHK